MCSIMVQGLNEYNGDVNFLQTRLKRHVLNHSPNSHHVYKMQVAVQSRLKKDDLPTHQGSFV